LKAIVKRSNKIPIIATLRKSGARVMTRFSSVRLISRMRSK
jgi:hypothetical protein